MRSEKDTTQPSRASVWGDLFAAAGIFLAAMLASGLCFLAINALASGLAKEPSSAILYTVQFGLAIAGIYVYFRRRAPRSARLLRFEFNWFDAPLTLLGIVLVTAASIVLEPVLRLFPERYFDQMAGMVGSGGWAILLTVVIAPVLEELLFRGLVLERALRGWRTPAAVTVSALLFGLAHAPNLPMLVNALVMGVVLGCIYVLTRSLIPVIAIHAINNGVAYLLLETTGTQSTDTRALMGNDTVYWIIFTASAAILAVSLAGMARTAGNKTGERTLQEKDR